MTEKRLCTNCKHSRGLGYDFWCGEGHTEYEVFGAETNCPYYEYHDWSKGTPSKTEKRFTTVELPKPNRWGIWYDGACLSTYQVCILLNEYVDVKKENEQLKQQLSDINGQLVMLDNCDNWDYDRMKHTVREIAEIIGYNGTINPKR